MRKTAVVARGEPASPGVKACELAQLRQPQARREIGEIVLVPVGENLVAPVARGGVALPGVAADAVQGEHACPLRGLGVAHDQHPALAGRDVLGGVEAEGSGIAQRAHASAAVARRQGVRGVLDHRQPPAARDIEDRVHVTGEAGDVDGDHRSRARGARALDVLATEIARHGIDVGKDWSGAEVRHRLGGRRERVGRQDDVVTRLDAEHPEREVERGGAGRDGERVRHAEERWRTRARTAWSSGPS